jgi:hypothetical protein
MSGASIEINDYKSYSRQHRLVYSLRVGPHPHALSLGGALRALHSVASLGPQALASS